MKYLILILFMAFPTAILAQENKDFEAERYLKKSISKRKTGNVLAITGGALFLSGIIVAAADHNKGELLPTSFLVGGTITSLGILSAVSSIPFYISAGNNKKKYLKISPTAAMLAMKTRKENYALIGLEISF